jgi:Tol biopolymer transport system component
MSEGVPTIWRVPMVDPVSFRWRTPERLTMGTASAGGGAVSPDGQRLAFTSARAPSRAWLFPFDADGGRLEGDGRPLTEDDLSIAFFDLSRDGTTLLYCVSEPGSAQRRLFRTDTATGHRTYVADAEVGVSSRDGGLVSYLLKRLAPARSASAGSRPSSEFAIAVRDPEGRERLISTWLKGPMYGTDWARDDRTIVGSLLSAPYVGGSLAIWRVGPSPASKPERVLLEATTNGPTFWQASFSPNDRWVSFVAGRLRQTLTLELGVVAAHSSRATTWTRIASDHVWPDKPRWSPDGHTLYFLSRGSDGYFNLWGVRMDPERGVQVGSPFQITHFNSPRWRIEPDVRRIQIGVAPGRLVLPMQSVKGSIWVLSGIDH